MFARRAGSWKGMSGIYDITSQLTQERTKIPVCKQINGVLSMTHCDAQSSDARR